MVIRFALNKNNQKVVEEQTVWRGTNCYVKISLISLKVSAICTVEQYPLLQPHRTVVANFVPGNFGLFRRNPWQPLAEHKGSAEPRLKNTALML